MGQARGGLGFNSETPRGLGATHKASHQGLQGYLSIQSSIVGFVDRTHPATSNGSDNHVPANVVT